MKSMIWVLSHNMVQVELAVFQQGNKTLLNKQRWQRNLFNLSSNLFTLSTWFIFISSSSHLTQPKVKFLLYPCSGNNWLWQSYLYSIMVYKRFWTIILTRYLLNSRLVMLDVFYFYWCHSALHVKTGNILPLSLFVCYYYFRQAVCNCL